MKPERENNLVELLDRCLNKGIILNADVIISVAGVPLIGISLKAALASIETMLDYGMMEAWDKSTREWYAKESEMLENAPLLEDERLILRIFGSIWYSEGIIPTWKSGFWYLTNRRLFLWIKTGKTFETYLDKINGLMVKKETQFNNERDVIVLRLECGDMVGIHSMDIMGFKEAILKAAATRHEKIRGVIYSGSASGIKQPVELRTG